APLPDQDSHGLCAPCLKMSPESSRKRSEPVAAPPLKQHLLWARSDDCDGALGGRSMRREMTVDGVRIADDTGTYVIAEIGSNHQGNVEKCKEMFKVAKQHCGVTAVKLQKRDNRSLFTRAMYDSQYNSENAFADTYGAHREHLEFGRDEYIELIAYAKEVGITFFSTAFDIPSADFLADLDMPAFKLASGDLTNTPLLKHVAKFGKPMFVSTGGATMQDVRRAYETIMPINKRL